MTAQLNAEGKNHRKVFHATEADLMSLADIAEEMRKHDPEQFGQLKDAEIIRGAMRVVADALVSEDEHGAFHTRFASYTLESRETSAALHKRRMGEVRSQPRPTRLLMYPELEHPNLVENPATQAER